MILLKNIIYGLYDCIFAAHYWRGVRVADGARLESVYRGNSIAGSNPALSAFAHRSFAKVGFCLVKIALVSQVGLRRTKSANTNQLGIFCSTKLFYRCLAVLIFLNQNVWHVYILRCSDGSLYTGCSSNLRDRMNRHNKQQINYTRTRLPVELIVTISFRDKYKAFDFENYLKSGSGRAFMFKRFT